MLHTAEIVHWAALIVMGIVYSARLYWLFHFKAGMDRSAPANQANTNKRKGAIYSMANVAMPWSMESTRQGFVFYLSFVIFHLGVAAGILLAFTSTFEVTRTLLQTQLIGNAIAGFLIAGFLVSVYRVFRRLFRPLLRLISSPDDYFSLFMITAWLGLGVATQFHVMGKAGFGSEVILVAYLYLTSFFLLYVPFSKISHYLYYPFTRLWLGRALGHRGSMPVARG